MSWLMQEPTCHTEEVWPLTALLADCPAQTFVYISCAGAGCSLGHLLNLYLKLLESLLHVLLQVQSALLFRLT